MTTRKKSDTQPRRSVFRVIEALLVHHGYVERKQLIATIPMSGELATKTLSEYRRLYARSSEIFMEDKGAQKRYIPQADWRPSLIEKSQSLSILEAAEIYFRGTAAGFSARYALIDSVISIRGTIRRSDVMTLLGLSSAMSSKVLKEYARSNPLIIQSADAKRYIKMSEWAPKNLPAFRVSPVEYIRAAEIFLDYSFSDSPTSTEVSADSHRPCGAAA